MAASFGFELPRHLLLDLRRAGPRRSRARYSARTGGRRPLNRRADEVGVEVVRILLRYLRDAAAVDGPPHRQIDADREALVRLKGRRPRRTRALGRPVHLVAGRVTADLLDSREHQHGSRTVGPGRAVEHIGADEHFAPMHRSEGRVDEAAVAERREDQGSHEPRAPGSRRRGAKSAGQQGAEPVQPREEQPPDQAEKGLEAIRHEVRPLEDGLLPEEFSRALTTRAWGNRGGRWRRRGPLHSCRCTRAVRGRSSPHPDRASTTAPAALVRGRTRSRLCLRAAQRTAAAWHACCIAVD